MMTKLIKILPVLAIVAGIGGAFGFGANQDPCSAPRHTGYGQPNDDTLPPDAPINSSVPNYGLYLENFGCNQTQPARCHWVYVPGEEEEEGEWIPCETGQRFVM